MKPKTTTKLAKVQYAPLVRIADFRLVAEPTLDALANDIGKFYNFAAEGVDRVLLGRFCLGISLIKAKKIVGNASRGNTAKGETGWMNWKKTTFPDYSNHALTDAINFTTEIFAEWEKHPQKGKISTVENLPHLRLAEPLAFQLPENPDELNGLLTAIHNTMDGKKMTAFCRSIGRIRDAIKPGTNSNGPGERLSQGEMEDINDPLIELEKALIGLADPKDLTFADCNSARLRRFADVLLDCQTRANDILKSRKNKS